MNKYFGIALIVLALGIGIIPHYTDCLSEGKTMTLASGATQPMKCHWTAQAEIAVALPLAAVGVMMSTSKRKSSLMSLSIIGVVLGAATIALPNGVIGTCGMATHICNTAMKPTMNALGSLTVVGSLAGLVMSRRLES